MGPLFEWALAFCHVAAAGGWILSIFETRIPDFLRRDVEGRDVAGYASTHGLNPSPSLIHRVWPPFGSGVYGPSAVVADRQGRLIVGGNFLSVGGVDRPGLVRLLEDGRPDPGWNPGQNWASPPRMRIRAPWRIFLSRRPPTSSPPAVMVAVGPDDSVVVGINTSHPCSAPDRRIAVIDAHGEVRSVFRRNSCRAGTIWGPVRRAHSYGGLYSDELARDPSASPESGRA